MEATALMVVTSTMAEFLMVNLCSMAIQLVTDSTMGTESSVMVLTSTSMDKTYSLEGLAMVLMVSPMAVISTTATMWMGLMLYMVTQETSLVSPTFSPSAVSTVSQGVGLFYSRELTSLDEVGHLPRIRTMWRRLMISVALFMYHQVVSGLCMWTSCMEMDKVETCLRLCALGLPIGTERGSTGTGWTITTCTKRSPA